MKNEGDPVNDEAGAGVEPSTRMDHFRSDLDHISRLQALLTVSCVLILYLTAASWSSAPEVLRDLRRLRSTVKALREKTLDQGSVMVIQPQIAEKCLAQIRGALDAAVAEPLHFRPRAASCARSAFCLVSIDGMNAAGESFEKTKAATRNVGLTIRRIDAFHQNRLREFGQWVNRQRDRGLETVVVTDIQCRWPEDSEADCQLALTVVCSDKGGAIPRNSRVFALPFESCESSEWSDTRFWESFKGVPSWVEQKDLQDKPLGVAIAAASTSLTSGVEDDQGIGGIQFKGVHTGYLGPVAVIAVLLYLAIFATSIAVRRREFAPEVEAYLTRHSRWLPLVRTVPARIVSITCIALLPLLAVVLPIWRLTALGPEYAVPAGLLSLLIAAWILLPSFAPPSSGRGYGWLVPRVPANQSGRPSEPDKAIRPVLEIEPALAEETTPS